MTTTQRIQDLQSEKAGVQEALNDAIGALVDVQKAANDDAGDKLARIREIVAKALSL